MEMKVEIVSREIIKPSSPTPYHLRTFNLSFLDQIAPIIYIPVVLFYTNNNSDSGADKREEVSRVDILKKSLSESLTRYYPLAGRIKFEDSLVDCIDEGVDIIEAKVNNSRLSQHIKNPDVQVLKQFLPCQPYTSDYESELNSKVLLAVQVNIFDCGGMVIGLCMSHKVADASSLSNFIDVWAATARGDAEKIKVSSLLYDTPTVFPKVDLKGFSLFSGIIQNEELIVTKKFVFEGSKIDELKKLSCGSDNIQLESAATRVEAVSAFIWNRFIDLDQAKEEVAAASQPRVYTGTQAVNIRARMVPPLPTNTFGNLYTTTFAPSIIKDANEGKKESQYPNLVGKLREAIKKVDGDHIKGLQNTDAYLNHIKQRMKIVSSAQASSVMLHFSSWCRFPLYEADFGWGKPEWVTIAPLPYENVVVLVDTKSGDGIEACVHMTKEDMAEFEHDKELLAFVS